MTPDALRSAIASARLRPRAYGTDAADLATYLLGLVTGASPDGTDPLAAWRDAQFAARPARTCVADLPPLTDAAACDAAEATVAALWPQGDAFDLPGGVECFRTGDDAGRLRNLLAVIHRDGGHHVERVGIAQACVDAAARVLAAYHAGDAPARWAAEPGALDLDAIKALAQKVVSDDEGGSDVGWRALELARDHVPALLARVRELEAEAADMREGVAYAGASCDREIQVHGVWLRASRLGTPSDVRHYAEVAAARDEALAEVERLRAQLAAAQPAPLDFRGALAAVRNGRFVPSSAWARCLACDGTCADVDGAPCEPCRGTGRHPPPLADRDLCPKCGALDLDHTVEECARRWAEKYPGAAAGFVGAERAPKGET